MKKIGPIRRTGANTRDLSQIKIAMRPELNEFVGLRHIGAMLRTQPFANQQLHIDILFQHFFGFQLNASAPLGCPLSLRLGTPKTADVRRNHLVPLHIGQLNDLCQPLI
ncbi:MAG: hypothetical protein ACD_62C00447G0002 [uncultured bacterium]|nr:MAG: hypothetical protein ACD_62C00447G0002 [uncultured bacterium]